MEVSIGSSKETRITGREIGEIGTVCANTRVETRDMIADIMRIITINITLNVNVFVNVVFLILF